MGGLPPSPCGVERPSKDRKRMSSSEMAEFDRQLKLRGWSYDPADEEFRSPTGLLDWEEVVGLIPDLSRDDLAAYQERKYDEWRRHSLAH
jgi:hypothetical protein